MQEGLPKTYYYHNYGHAIYVRRQALEIGRLMHCTGKELDLLGTAALWHDTGFIHKYAGHEEEGCLLAQKYLPDYGYGAADIDCICQTIMATRLPQSPTCKLGEILADADLAYLGTPEAAKLSGILFKEMQSINPGLTGDDWKKTQIGFISAHHYFTPYCIESKEPGKQAYLRSLLAS